MHLAAKLLQSKGKQLDSLWEKSRKQPFVFFFLICSNNEIVVLTAQMSTVCCVKGLRIELVVTCSFTVVAVWIVLRWQLLVTQLLSFCILYNLFHIHSFFFRCTLCPVALYRFLHVLCETFYFRPKTHICDYQAIKALLHSAAHPLLTVLWCFSGSLRASVAHVISLLWYHLTSLFIVYLYLLFQIVHQSCHLTL